VEQEQTVPENTGPVVGIDLGVKKLKRLQRVVSRRKKGGKNRKKAVHKLAKLHRQIKHQNATTRCIRSPPG
jgi:transposase